MPAVLIVLMGSLGDIARALPLASILKHDWPTHGAGETTARISWVVDWRWQDVLATHPAVDRLVVFPRERTPMAIARFVRSLREERYDLVLDLQRILKSGVCSVLSGATRRIGFDRASAKEGNALFNTEHLAPQPSPVSKLRHYLAFAVHLGLPTPEPLDFGLDAFRNSALRPRAVQAIGSTFVAVVMGSSWLTKDWTVEGYRDLVSIVLRETSHSVVLLGTAAHRTSADHVARDSNESRVVNVVGQTSLVELVATLAAARAAVGPDSGPGHLAAALGVPCVTLFGPTDVARVAPYRCEHLAVRTPVECLGCARHRCRRRAGRCMDALEAPLVWSVLRPLL